ncbi:l-aminoadipate-semialdehyde dehydrogenase large [Cyclospora cayetanensis]|uniref:L-aminoadipate-semialdehyde dehydrogenase large n=1 Tax=Cyclospora cayetanensis TaxID=88456 RepID=A0A1D3D365_9EIME|nr:l-aminoadipate-semialdehyde dehydrogenase large [Cyclospora cayetanensis]
MADMKRKMVEASTATQSDASETTSPSSRPLSPPVEALWNRFCGNPFGTAFQKWAKEVPDAEAVVWLNGEGDIAERRTYKELLDQIYTLAEHLEDIGIKRGDRVILCYPPGIEFIIAFFSCIISGIAAVPVYPPDPTKGITDIPRFCDIGESAGTKRALTSTVYRRVAAAMSVVSREKRWRDVEWICTDTIKTTSSLNRTPAALDPHSIAFLQFTSGSTSEPKGVMVTHLSLLHNMHLCWNSFEFPTHSETKDPAEQFSTRDYNFYDLEEFWRRRHEVSTTRRGHRVRAFSWLPVYHDMGLIGFVCCPLFCGAALYQMSPIDFIRRPWVWLKAMSQYDCVCSAAPNFAFGLVTRKMPENIYAQLDLSRVTGILSGAEPVRRQTVEQFVEVRKASFGQESPCTPLGKGNWQAKANVLYVDALTLRAERKVKVFTEEEAALRPAGEVQDVVSCGFPFEGVTVKIVDTETNKELPEGHVGEIIAFSESVALGYFNKPEQTELAFRVSIIDLQGNRTPATGLRTGDCGFLYHGQLYVTGRFKDIIIIRGRNYYPPDIEEAVLEVPQIRPGCVAAFAIEADSNEVLGIAAELRVEDGLKGVWARVRRQLFDRSSYDQIVKNICRVIATATGLSVHMVWLLKPRSLPKTSSGKLRRSLARDKLLDGSLDGVLHTYTHHVHPVEASSSAARTGCQAPTKSPTQQLSESAHKGHEEAAQTHETVLKTVRDAVIDAAKNVLGDDGELPDMQAPLHELGVDSIAAVELAELVSEKLNIDIEPTLMFNYPTMEDIIDFLVREIEGKGGEDALTINATGSEMTMAVVGAACNLPGGSTSLSSFWDALMCGVDAMVEVPRSRWDVEDYFDPDPDAEGKMYIREGGFIENAEFFDASFFRISLAEASSMDPQQRLLLEVGYEALHDSGFDKDSLLRANIGTFVGCCCNEWQQTCAQMGLGISSFTATSHAPSILSNRLSYTLGMLGPSLTVDTACSSSLVALHIAIQEIKAGSCFSALVAGVNLMLSPNVTVAFCKARMMAPDARCKTFDASANGYVRGEGLGAIVIKPLSEAMKEDSRIICIVRGTAVNHGGRAASLTAPSGPSQERIIRTALRNANVTPDEVLFVETHGTGTSLGDPIEVGALKSVFRSSRDSPLLLGAVKTNIGHLEGAAGIAGFLKSALALRHKQMPPNLHFKTWNPHIDLKGAKFICPVTGLPITPPKGKQRIGGVSSFGFGGANAHAVLQEAPHVCELRRPCKAQKPTAVCFMFGSQGVEDLEKCRGLYDGNPVFAKVLNDCGDILKRLVSVPLLSILFSDQDTPRSAERAHGQQPQQWLRQTRFAEPVLFAFEYALGKSLIAQGVKPDAVMGVGVGEFVAAAIAGVMSLEDGLRVACQRAKLVETFLPSDAVAVACRAGEKDVEMAISEAGGVAGSSSSVAMSLIYGQKQLVLSGIQSELESVLMKLDIAGRFKYLQDRVSFSSPLLSDVITPLERIMSGVKLSRPSVRMICATTGEFCDEQVLSGHYWTRHLTRTVRFDQCISNLVSAGCKLLVEINGRAALIRMGQQSVDETAKDVEWVFAFPAADEETSERQTTSVQKCLSVLNRIGEQLEMEHGLHGHDELLYHRKPIPWVQIPHPFVGKHRELGVGEFLFETSFPRRAVPLFADHMVNGKAMMPGMGMAEIVASAAFALDLKTASGAVALENVFFERPMMIGSQRVTYEFNTRTGTHTCGRRSPRTVRTPRRVNDAYVRRPRADSDSRGLSTPGHASPTLAPSAWLVSPSSSKASTPKLASSEPKSRDNRLKVELEEVSQSLLSNRGALPDDHVVPQDLELTIRCHIMKNLGVELRSVWDDETSVHCSASIVLSEQQKEETLPSLKELQERCNQPVSVPQLYESLFDLGLQYGPRFRSVNHISRSESEALARLMLPEGCKQDSFESGFLVHPALLDGALHVAASLIGRHASRAHVSMVPVGAGRILLRKLEGKAGCWAHVELLECRSRSAMVNVRLFDDSWQVAASLEKVYLRNVDIGGSVGASIPRDLIWKVKWEKRAELTAQPQDFVAGKGPVLVIGGSLQLMEALSNSLGGEDFGRVLSVEDIPSTRADVQELLASGNWRAIAFVEALTADEYAALDVPHAAIRLLQAYSALLSNGSNMPPVWLFTSGIMDSPQEEAQTPSPPDLPAHAGLWGLAKAARLEIGASTGTTTQIGCLDIEQLEKDDDVAKAIVTFLRSSMATSDESELMLRGNTLYAARIEKSDLAVRGALELYMPERGAISNLVVRPQAFAARVPPAYNQVEVRVRAVGLNFRDVLNVMDLYPGDPGPPGADFAGTVVAVGDDVEHVRVGDRVYGIAPGALRTYATTDANLVRRAPSSLGFEASAALPVVAATVEHALGDVAQGSALLPFSIASA